MLLGMERNSDIVKMASFAPLLEHFDMAEWSVCSAPRCALEFLSFLIDSE